MLLSRPATRPLPAARLRWQHTLTEIRQHRNALFNSVSKQRHDSIRRIEKIKVEFIGEDGGPHVKSCTLLMNKDLSTPFNCAQHVGQLVGDRSMIAMVDGKPYDMHRPLTADSTLQLVHAKHTNKSFLSRLNEAYWRTGSFLLGFMLERMFHDELTPVELCRFPPARPSDGCFSYDVDLHLDHWTPTAEELDCMSAVVRRLIYKRLRFERLHVSAEVAAEMFRHNRFKREQVADIAAKHNGNVPVYRLDDHCDICSGPLIGDTGQLGHFAVASLHRVHDNQYGPLSRVQAVSLPADFNNVHPWTFSLMVKYAVALRSPYKRATRPVDKSSTGSPVPKQAQLS